METTIERKKAIDDVRVAAAAVEGGEGGAGGGIQPLQAMYVQVEQRPTVNSETAKSTTTADCPHTPGGSDPTTTTTTTSTSGTATGGRYVVTVKLECPDSQVITQAWTLAASAGSLKERLSRMVELPVGTLHLLHAGRQVHDHVTLGELGGRVNETISLSLRSTDPVAFPIRIKSTGPEDLMPLPDVITVRIRQSELSLFFSFISSFYFHLIDSLCYILHSFSFYRPI